MDQISTIKKNLEIINQRVEKAAEKSGRQSKDIQVVVVTKLQSAEVIKAAIEAGVTVFGENYPEEAEGKIIQISNPDVQWHMVGHLQSRKVKIIANHFSYLHSLDSVKLAEKLNRQLEGSHKKLPVLLELNVGGEESKFGWPAGELLQWENLLPDVETLSGFQNLEITGLMTMPPINIDLDKSRHYFRQLREIGEYFSKHCPISSWKELSMGTSNDFECAIEEGATFVRIGQAILGQRTYK